jgi:FlaA1/EpsC-like NDP-sugar epimerase
MTLDQSIDLIEAAILGATSGEIWLPKLKSMKIMELAQIFSDRYGVEIQISGIRPGEKLHEELISESESIRVDDTGKFLKLKQSLSENYSAGKVFSYSSKDSLMNRGDLEIYLEGLGIFDKSLSSFLGREIEEISIPKDAS